MFGVGVWIIEDFASKNRKALTKSLTSGKRRSDKIFRTIVIAVAGYTLLMVALVGYAVIDGSWDIFSFEGLGFLTGTDWNAVEGRESFGALPYIIGTLVSAGIAMVIGVPISLGIAIFISEMSPSRLATPISFVIEVLALCQVSFMACGPFSSFDFG